MKTWKHKINIKQHLGEDTNSAAVAKAASGVIQELKRLPEGLEDLWLQISDFEDILEDAKENDDDDGDLADEFNYRLGNLYDWADYNRIWLGL